METLSKNDELKLIGLKTLANHHNQFLSKIREAVMEIVGASDAGLASDFVYDENVTIERMLAGLQREKEMAA